MPMLQLPLVLPLDVDDVSHTVAGGKGANLARLTAAGFPVPGGFLVTTHAYKGYVLANRLEEWILRTVHGVRSDDLTGLEAASEAIQKRFAAGTVLPELSDALRAAYVAMECPPVAVRSSSTIEDLPDMSSAGQHDTYLNIVGIEALLQAVVNCWKSLWSARALGYRAHRGHIESGSAMAVIVQRLVQSETVGVLSTANPLNGKRTEIVIEAAPGPGEALMSGQVQPDRYVVDASSGAILSKTLGGRGLSRRWPAAGNEGATASAYSPHPTLPDGAIIALAHLGRHVAEFFGVPQDIEWAWGKGEFFLLQSRPITSLFSVPESITPEPLRVLISIGAIQGVLEPITPLGQEVLREVIMARIQQGLYHRLFKTPPIIAIAGGRLFLDVTDRLHSRRMHRLRRNGFLREGLEHGIAQALDEVCDNPRLASEASRLGWRRRIGVPWRCVRLLGSILFYLLWPAFGRARIQHKAEKMVSAVHQKCMAAATLAQQVVLLQEVFTLRSHAVIPNFAAGLAAGLVSLYLIKRLTARLPDGASDVGALTRGMPYNVTTEMGLALWATAQSIKADQVSAACFEGTTAARLAADYLAGRLPAVAQAAVGDFLQRYGTRGIAEIDLGRPRWCEDPTLIMQGLQSCLRIDAVDHQPDKKFERRLTAAEAVLANLAEAAYKERMGWLKARLVRWAGRRTRALLGLREGSKFLCVQLLGLVRERLLASGRELAAAGVLAQPDDLFFLHLSELKALIDGDTQDWRSLVTARRQFHAREQRRRQVPCLLLSDGQAYYPHSDAPEGRGEAVLVGFPVSPGSADGVVHVVLDAHRARLRPGEILVCQAADPAWTPLFLAAGGLVMEVGGLMTHASVVAREHGIPTVVGVHHATTRLRTGERVRVDGSTGQVIVLDQG